MKIVCGNCGHIEARWDNHHNYLKYSSCLMLSTCSTCSTWSEETWVLADKRCIYAARTSVMTRKRQNKKKRLAVASDLSDDNTFDGITTPQGYTARGRTLQGGVYSDAECKSTRDRSPVIGQPGTGQQSPVNQSLVRQSPVKQALVNQASGNFFTSCSVITRHPSPGS